MSEEVNVLSRTQRIIVEPVTRSVAVINAGPAGPTGPGGDKGDQGEAGGSLLSAFWQYSNTAGTPPGSGQMRTNSPTITHLYVHETDTDGFHREVGLGSIASGGTILVRCANGTSMDLLVTGVPIDMGLWWDLPVSVLTGLATKGSRTQLNFINPSQYELPVGGTTGQLLAKKTNALRDVEWVNASDPSVVAPVRRTMRTTNASAVQPATSWENTMTTTTASAAVTITLPSFATEPFAIGAEVDILQMGTGQVTFVAGSGAAIFGTPGLKLRAQYSAATCKVIATNNWIVIGDLSA